jgi:hypothetical protein
MTQTIPYQTGKEISNLNVQYHNQTFWLTLSSMSKLFNCSTQKIYKTLKDILKKDILIIEEANMHLEVKTKNGKRSTGNFYNLDIIMAIGYMLNPKEATEFRLWSMFVIKNNIFQQAKMEYSVVGSLKRGISHLISA